MSGVFAWGMVAGAASVLLCAFVLALWVLWGIDAEDAHGADGGIDDGWDG